MSAIEVRTFAGHARYSGQLHTPIRVAHLTDQHFGRPTPMSIQMEAVRAANAASPDLVALTGDFVCYELDWLDQLEQVVGAFAAPVVAVLGNHDHWTGAAAVRRSLRRAGVQVLDNASTIFELRGQRLQVVGLDDAYTGHSDPERATRGLCPKTPTLGLSHVGEAAQHLWDRGVPLVLSGHTHAGQIAIAKLNHLSMGRLGGHRYVHGLYGDRRGDGALYVGAGIGSGKVPFRVGKRARREVALFDLGLSPGAYPEHHAEQKPLPARPDGRLARRLTAQDRRRSP